MILFVVTKKLQLSNTKPTEHKPLQSGRKLIIDLEPCVLLWLTWEEKSIFLFFLHFSVFSIAFLVCIGLMDSFSFLSELHNYFLQFWTRTLSFSLSQCHLMGFVRMYWRIHLVKNRTTFFFFFNFSFFAIWFEHAQQPCLNFFPLYSLRLQITSSKLRQCSETVLQQFQVGNFTMTFSSGWFARFFPFHRLCKRIHLTQSGKLSFAEVDKISLAKHTVDFMYQPNTQPITL